MSKVKKPVVVKSGSWLTVVPWVHRGRRRIGKLLPIRIEPGRKIILGRTVEFRHRQYLAIGFGYESGQPIIHLRDIV